MFDCRELERRFEAEEGRDREILMMRLWICQEGETKRERYIILTHFVPQIHKLG